MERRKSGGLIRRFRTAPLSRMITLLCLEDGKKFKMLKRHLMTNNGMTPDEYRALGLAGKLFRGRSRIFSDAGAISPGKAASVASLERSPAPERRRPRSLPLRDARRNLRTRAIRKAQQVDPLRMLASCQPSSPVTVGRSFDKAEQCRRH